MARCSGGASLAWWAASALTCAAFESCNSDVSFFALRTRGALSRSCYFQFAFSFCRREDTKTPRVAAKAGNAKLPQHANTFECLERPLMRDATTFAHIHPNPN